MFRVILDLSHYFHNQKRKARIFIKENIKTVADLLERISDVFSIQDFDLYASDGQHFLPHQEDIRVLNNDEVVSVIPKGKNELVEKIAVDLPPSAPSKPPKKSKRRLETVMEESDSDLSLSEEKLPKKRKKKSSRKEYTPVEEMAVDLPPPPPSKPPKKSKGSLESVREETDSDLASSEEQMPKKRKKKSTGKLSEECSVKTQHKTSNRSNSVTLSNVSGGTDKNPKLNTLLPILKSHINSCDKTGHYVSSPASTSVRLSHHVDSPVAKFKNAKSIPTITDEVICKKKVNIVKIDIIKHPGEVEINGNSENENLTVEKDDSNADALFSTPRKNFVKKVVKHIETEKSLSPEKVGTSCNSSLESEDLQLWLEKSEIEDLAQNKSKFSSNNSNIHLQDSPVPEIDCSEMPKNDSTFKHPKNSFSTTESQKTSNFDAIQQRINAVEIKTDSLDITKNSPFALISYYGNNKLKKTEQQNDVISNSLDLHCSSSFDEGTSNLEEKTENSLSLQNASPFAFLNNLSDFKSVSVNHQAEPPTNVHLKDLSATDSPPPTNEVKEENKKSESPAQTDNFFYMKRKLAGVGAYLAQLKNSDEGSLASTPDFVTKRSRHRIRRRRSKKSIDHSNEPTSDASCVDTYVQKPLNVSATPRMHVKFHDDDDETFHGNSSEQTQNATDNKTAEIEEHYQETDKNLPEHIPKAKFSEDAILKSQIMLESEPKEGNIIAFQLLTLKGGTPVVSQYVVGRVLEFSKEKGVKFEILEGQCENEFEDEQTSKIKEYPWEKLIAPRLMFP